MYISHVLFLKLYINHHGVKFLILSQDIQQSPIINPMHGPRNPGTGCHFNSLAIQIIFYWIYAR